MIAIIIFNSNNLKFTEQKKSPTLRGIYIHVYVFNAFELIFEQLYF